MSKHTIYGKLVQKIRRHFRGKNSSKGARRVYKGFTRALRGIREGFRDLLELFLAAVEKFVVEVLRAVTLSTNRIEIKLL